MKFILIAIYLNSMVPVSEFNSQVACTNTLIKVAHETLSVDYKEFVKPKLICVEKGKE